MRKDNKDFVFYFVLALVLGSSILTAILLEKYLFYPYSLDSYGNDALNFYMPLSSLYPTYSQHPATMGIYGPISYIVFDTVNAAVRTSNRYMPNRVITYLLLLVDAFLLYLVSKGVAKMSRRYALLVALVFLADSYIFIVQALYDPVLYELAFDLVALLAVSSKARHSCLYAGFILAIAFFAKQTALVMVLGVLIYYLINKRIKEAAGFMAAFLLVATPIALYLNAASNGGYLFSAIILPLLIPHAYLNFLYFWIIVPLSTLLVPMLFLTLRGANKKSWGSLLFIVFVMELLSTLSIEKFGATTIYFMIPFALACILGVSQLEKLKNRAPGPYVPMVLCIFAIFSVYTLVFQVAYMHAYNRNETATNQVESALSGINGAILSENPSYAFDIDRSLAFNPEPGIFLEGNLWNDSYLVGMIDNRSFAAIVFPSDDNRFYSFPGIMPAIQTHYSEKDNFSGIYIYVPDNSSA